MYPFVVGGLSAVLNIFFSQACVVVASRFVPKDELGFYFIVLSWSAVLSIILDVGARGYYPSYLLRKSSVTSLKSPYWRLAINRRINTINLYVFLCFLPFALVSFYWSPIFLISLGLALLMAFYSSGFIMRLAKGEYVQGYVGSTVSEVVRLVLFYGLIQKFSGVMSLMLSMFISRCVGLYIFHKSEFFVVFFRRLPYVKVKNIFRKVHHIYFSSILSLVSVKGGDMIVTMTMSRADVALLNIAMQIPATLLRVFETVKVSFLRFSSGIELNLYLLYVVMFVIIGEFFLWVTRSLSDSIFLLLFGDSFKEALHIFHWLLYWVVVSLANYLLVLRLVFEKKAHLELLSNKLATIVSVFLYFIFLKIFGIVGSSMVMCIVATLLLCLNTYSLKFGKVGRVGI